MDDTDRPDSFPDGNGDAPYGAPEGAIVDGYQILDRIWWRIDRPTDIDLQALNATLPLSRPLTLDEAVELWQRSIGEMEVADAHAH